MLARMNALPLLLGVVALGACSRAVDGTRDRVVHVTTTEYSFDAPARIPAGLTTFELTNRGSKLHEMSLTRLTEGKTLKDFEAVMTATDSFPSWAIASGGVAGAAANGGVNRVTETLVPGQYVIACFVPDSNQAPHASRGMLRELTVVPNADSTAPMAEPNSDVTLALTEFAFTPSPQFATGHHIVRVENDGAQPHSALLVRLAAGATFDSVMKWGTTMTGPAPFQPTGGVTALAPGAHAFFPVDLTPGTYLLLCFEGDTHDHGKPHLMKGMEKQFTLS